jgi:hypothetical protein
MFIRKRGNSWSLEERYRDPVTGKVKSRYIRKLSKRSKRLPREPRPGRYGVDWDEIERLELERMEREELEHQKLLARQQVSFHKATGLTLPIGPPSREAKPIEKGQTDTHKDFHNATGWYLHEVLERGHAESAENKVEPTSEPKSEEPKEGD